MRRRSQTFSMVALATTLAFAATLTLAPSAYAKRKKRKGTLTIYSFVKGAKVEINNQLVGSTPIKKPVSLKPGAYNVRVYSRGYQDFTETVTIRSGKNHELDADLIAFAGWIILSANVENATVAIDGKLSGTVPLDRDVPAGKHEISVQKDGYLPFLKVIEIQAAKPYKLNVVLKPVPVMVSKTEESILNKWWFWTIVGSVVASGTALGIGLGLQNNDPKVPEAAQYTIPLP